MYVYKEVWVHPVSRWLWVMQDLMASPAARATDSSFAVTSTTASNGEVTIRLTAGAAAAQSYVVRAEHLIVERPMRMVAQRPTSSPVTIEWKARPVSNGTPWVAVVIPDGDVARRREVVPPR